MTSEKKGHFIFLDGMRGIAALAVGWLHASDFFRLSFQPHHAALAVDFFFVLSGFVIAHAYEKNFARGMTFSDFALRRVIRLYPLILLGVVLGTFVSMAFPASNPAESTHYWLLGTTALVLFPLGTLLGLEAFPVNNPIWSLFFELIANGVYGFSQARRKPYRLLVPALILSALALVLVVFHYGSIEYVGFAGKTITHVLGLVRVSFPFLAGILIYRYRLYVPRFAGFDFLLALTLIAVLAMPYWQRVPAYDLVCILLVFPLLVSMGANDSTHPLVNKLWKLSGELSYPFYLIHLPILKAVSALYLRYPIKSISPGLAAWLSLDLAAVVAYCLLHVYDVPVRTWLTAARANRRAPQTQPTPRVVGPSPGVQPLAGD